ncbi:kunitz-type protease inhibitor 2 isoform X7 [Monodelphis domestica]|uniref:kunitz-type protease inhibitor 2 isoform X7 n=1 Tax=Monodelphis domestica TaxID=13616 RepID=UPI0024E19BAC|nr:kunitz-type protease inhibitor 2 isoform X7 [Monodelphis domestica]
MGQQPHFPALLPLLGVLLLAGAAWSFDYHPASLRGSEEPADLQAPKKQDSEAFPGNDFNYEDYCAAKAVTGPCRAAFQRWFFDAEKNTCAHFIYGGCRGNKNSYLTQEDCMSKCFGKRTYNSSHPVVPHSTKGEQRPKWTCASGVALSGSFCLEPLLSPAVALAVLLAVMAAVLLGAMVVIFIKMARKNQASAFSTVWSPIDDKEYLVKSAYTL